MKIDIILFCHNFQHRLCWMLSSIAQQVGDIPEIGVNITCLQHNGEPTTETVAYTFGKHGLDIKLNHVTEKALVKPSVTKNDQIAQSDADYILAWSADQIFAPDYFAAMKQHLKGNLGTHTGCLASRLKMMADKEAVSRVMACNRTMYIEDAYDKLAVLPRQVFKKRSKNGLSHRVGGHLLFNREAMIQKTGGMYIDPAVCPDRNLFKRGMKTRSDMHFRKAMGVTKTMPLPMSIHMEHERDKEHGKHIEEQR